MQGRKEEKRWLPRAGSHSENATTRAVRPTRRPNVLRSNTATENEEPAPTEETRGRVPRRTNRDAGGSSSRGHE